MFSDISHLLLNTTPVDRDKATEAVNALYRRCKLPRPEVVIVSGPKDLDDKIDLDDEGVSFFDYQEIAHFVSRRGLGKQEKIRANILSLFKSYSRPKNMKAKYLGSNAVFFPTDYQYNGRNQWEKFATGVWDATYATVNFRKKCYVIDRPQSISANERGISSFL